MREQEKNFGRREQDNSSQVNRDRSEDTNRGLGSQDDDMQQMIANGAQEGTTLRKEQYDMNHDDMDEDLQKEVDPSQKRKVSTQQDKGSGRYGTEEGSSAGKKTGNDAGRRL